MKTITAIFIISIFCSSIATAQIYKWRDENGKLHFSDTPPVTAQKTEEITVKDNVATGVNRTSPAQINKGAHRPPSKKKLNAPKSTDIKKTISARDYKITRRIEVNSNVVTISGRISSGPKCENMRVEAFAVNEDGNRAHVTDMTSKPFSHGSTIFSGKDRVYGNSDSDWEITSLYITCGD